MLLVPLAAMLPVACAPAIPAGAPAAAAAPLFAADEGIDHVLLWTREVERDSAVLSDRLGFQVVSGGTFPDGVANRLVLFHDDSYLELLYLTMPLAEADPQILASVPFLRERDGSIGSGMQVGSLELVAERLTAAGFAMGEASAGTYDPDGPDGPEPSQDSIFRTLGFVSSPIAGLDPFFVWYRPAPTPPDRQAHRAARRTHPNGALRLSALWIVTADAAASRGALVRMGYVPGREVALPHLGARGTVLTGGERAVLLVDPQAGGRAAEALRLRGPHVLGISVEVEDLEGARAIVARGYGVVPQRRPGPFGEAVIAPSQDDLGLFVEFHRRRG